MTIAVVYDTETSDMIQNCRDSDDSQPHLVQLAAALIDLDKKSILSSIDVMIKPSGWVFAQGAIDTHGITAEMAMDLGVPEKMAVEMFLELITLNDGYRLMVGHNERFDARIMRIAMKRYGFREVAEDSKESERYCTMKESTNIVQCPPTQKMIAAGRSHFKNPNLGEAYRHFTGKGLSGAHNAMVDVKACLAVYYGIQKHISGEKEA